MNEFGAVESLRQFQELAEHINQVLYILDVERGKTTYINPAYEQVWKRSRESLYADARSFLESVHFGECEAVAAAIKRQMQGETTQLEYRIVRPDGEVRWISDRAVPISNEQGRVVRVVGLAEDITRHRHTERLLREQTASLERVMATGQVLIAELDTARIVDSVTDAARELCGAQFGAFVYNSSADKGRITRVASSGMARDEFETTLLPRLTPLFETVFGASNSQETSSSVATDLGADVASVVAVPVVSRVGDVLGGLFFGHRQPNVFTPSRVRLVEHLATQAAVAIDNARLFEMVQQERAVARANEQDYQFLAESIPQIVWIAGPEGAVSYFNSRWNQYTGQTPGAGNEWGWQPVIHPDDLERTVECWTHSLQTGEPYEIEYRLKGRDGFYRWHLGRAAPLRDSKGQVLKWFGTCTDIHDQKSSQEAVRFLSDAGSVLASSLEYDQTVNSLTRLAVPMLCDWCVVDVEENGVLTRLAASHEDAEKIRLAFELWDCYLPRDLEAGGYYSVMRTGQSQLFHKFPDEMLAETAQDAEHLTRLREAGMKSAMIVPLSARGKTLGVMTLVSAESGRLFTEKDLILAEELARRAAEAVSNARLYREAQDALVKANEAMRARDEFLAIVSHELKTPLTPILGWVSLLQSTHVDVVKDDGVMSRALDIIERNVRTQSQLVDDLLDVSRIITGKLRLNLRPTKITPVIESAIETVQPAVSVKNIAIQMALEHGTGKVRGDSARLQQVMWNLLSNAIKFTPNGGQIQVRSERVDSTLQITVSDSGEGIPVQFLPYVFDRFQQLDSTSTRQHGGLGLGLSIVRHIVEMHGGTIKVWSEGEGRGATFTVRLPLLPDDVASTTGLLSLEDTSTEDVAFMHSLNSQTSPSLLEGLKILIVEDESDARDLMVAVLKGYGAQVKSASSAPDGLRELREWRPDLLVSDIGMPGEDGYSLIKKIRALTPKDGGRTPAIALTAYVRTEDRFKALSAGFQNHLAKPVEPAELAITIASALGRPIELG